jgi:tetratricopeptide (TPR) repeat protein
MTIPAFAQADEWWRVMSAGMEADRVGDYAHAAGHYREAISISEKLDAKDERRAYSWNSLAKTQDVLGDFANAEPSYRRALKLAEQSRGKRSPAYTLPLENLATMYLETGQNGRADRVAREALSLVAEFDPPDELALAMARSCLATIADMCGKHEEAIELATAAMAALERHPVAWTQLVATLNTVGAASFAVGNRAEAERRFLRGLAITEQNGGASHPLMLRVLCNLAAIELHDGRREEAGVRLRRALEIAEAKLGTAHPMYGSLLAWYAVYLRQTGEKSRAKAMETQAAQIVRDSGRRNGLGAVIDVTALRGK